jgi:squalene-associated FAD-dependent desaturase
MQRPTEQAKMKRAVVHIVGAGAAGLAAAHALADRGRFEVVVHEAAPHVGGRRRSFYDEALGLDVDSGNFPLISSWSASLSLIDAVGARDEWREESEPGVAFADFSTGERWRLRLNAGRIPWWLLHAKRRGPGLKMSDFLAAWRLFSASSDATVANVAPGEPAMTRLWRPLTLAALNSPPEKASARLAGEILRELLRSGGRALHIRTPVNGFGRAFVEPLVRNLHRAGVTLRCDRRLMALHFGPERLSALEFEHDRVDLGPRDALILATPWPVTAALVPGLAAPTGASAALTVHFASPPPPNSPAVVAALNGPFDWLFAYRDRLSVTIKDASARLETPRETAAAECWRGVAALTALSDAMPAWRVVPSRRASCLATPEETARRPTWRTPWRNLLLAGGHVGRSLPDSLETAVRSGQRAAQFALGEET